MPERKVIPGLAERLKTAREGADLSQQDAGERSGVHHISIARFETDKRVPTLDALYKLAAAYGVTIYDLLPEAVAEVRRGPDGLAKRKTRHPRGASK